MFAPLLDRLATTGVDLTQLVVTADALHCQRAHGTYLHERGAGFVFTAKQNQLGDRALWNSADTLAGDHNVE